MNIDHYFKIGDVASIIDSNDITRSTQIINVPSATTVLIRGQGTLPTETYRLRKNISKYDSVIGMYHDQILTPFKTLYGFDASNITLGLPFLSEFWSKNEVSRIHQGSFP